jgi:hypothetical protein
MKNWLSANARDKRAAHEYSLETFGLPREDIESAFASYRQRFGLSDP